MDLEKMTVEQLHVLLVEEDRKLSEYYQAAKAKIRAIRKVHDAKIQKARLESHIGKLGPDELTLLKSMLNQTVTPGAAAGKSKVGDAN